MLTQLFALVLTKLFNLMLKCGIVSDSFGHSYFVPNPKWNCSRGKSVAVDGFRAISICPVFELGVLDRFKNFLGSSDHPFGFKKNLRCNHAIYSMRKVFNSFNGSTVNICPLDPFKAFDETNHNALLTTYAPQHICTFVVHY